MKKLIPFAAAVATVILSMPILANGAETTDAPSNADASKSKNSETFSNWTPTLSGGLAGRAGTISDDGWFIVDGFYTPFEHMSGGGVSLSGEWIHPDVSIGLGGRVGLSFLSGHDSNYKIKNDTLNLDAHIPVKLTSWLIAYAGAGVQLFDMEYSYTVPGTFRYQDGRGGYYSRNGKTITFVCDKPATMTTLYVGLRVLLSEYFFLYGEYHKDSGTITMTCDDSYVGRYMNSMDVDMSASRYVIGGGFMF